MVRVEVRQDHVGHLMPRQAELREAMQRPRAAVEQDLEVPPSHPMACRRPGGRRRDRPGADGDQVHSGRLHLTESHPDDGRNAGLLHGDPVHGVGGLHGARVVRDDDELRQVFELREQAHVAAHVGVVQGRVHLVEQTEGTRLGEEDREQERHGDQRALAGREQVDPLRALPARRRVDLDLALERLVLVREPHVAFTPAEQRLEHRAEVLPHLPERVEEHRLGGLIDLTRRLLERLTRGHQVVPLRHQELQAFDLLAVLVHREGVDGSDRVDRRAQPLVLLAQPLEVAGDLGRVGEQLIEGLPPFGLDPRDEPAPAAQDLGALELEFVLLRATGVQRLARVLERRFRLGDARVRRLDLDSGLSGGALQSHEREAALLELVLPLGPLRRQSAALAEEMGALEHDTATLTAQRTQWEDQLKERRLALVALESAAREAGVQVEAADARVAQTDAALEDTRKALDARGAEEHKLELERTEVLGRRRGLVARVEAEWRKPFDQLLADAPEVAGDLEWLRQEDERLRAAIDAVGPVNALAVDEHGEEVKRLEFLMTQRDDLVAARQSLQQAAREIDQTAKAMFLDSFGKVR